MTEQGIPGVGSGKLMAIEIGREKQTYSHLRRRRVYRARRGWCLEWRVSGDA